MKSIDNLQKTMSISPIGDLIKFNLLQFYSSQSNRREAEKTLWCQPSCSSMLRQGHLQKQTEHSILTVTAQGPKLWPKNLENFTPTQSIFVNTFLCISKIIAWPQSVYKFIQLQCPSSRSRFRKFKSFPFSGITDKG